MFFIHIYLVLRLRDKDILVTNFLTDTFAKFEFVLNFVSSIIHGLTDPFKSLAVDFFTENLSLELTDKLQVCLLLYTKVYILSEFCCFY